MSLRAKLVALALPALLATTALTAPALAQAPAATPAAAPAITVPPIVYKQRTLANGLKVYTSLDRTTPNVSVQVWYDVGSKDDPNGRSGFAHLFEHLMFKATRDMPSETLDRLTEDVGGFNNASTWDDFTNYYEVVPANHLERLIWAEANRLSSLVVDDAIFKSERDVVKEEYRQSYLANPYGRLYLAIAQQSYAVHPYKRPGIGNIEELDASTVDDVRAFHQAYYRPDNAALIVVGNFDEAQLNAWIDKYFGPLKKPAEPIRRVTVVEPPRTGSKTLTAYGPNVPLPAVAITWLGPKASDKDAAAVKVLDAILSGGKSSRLYQSLVYEQQIAAEASSSADLPAQPGLVQVMAVMSEGKTVEQGEAALRAEVAKLRDAPPTPAELTEAKTELIAAAVRERETVDNKAFALGYALLTEGDAARANASIAELQAVTAADVQAAARKYMPDELRTVIRYLPESERKPGVAEALPPPSPKVASVKFTGPVFQLAPEGQRQARPPVGRPVDPSLPTPVERTLPNGLRVIVAKSTDLPLVTADLTVKSGAALDPAGLAGAASMTADLLTEGTTTRSATQIATEVEQLGAALNAGASLESSSVTLSVMPQNLDRGLAIMADVAMNPKFDPAEVDRVRTQSLDGLQVAYGQPRSVAGFVASPVLYAGTAFGHVASGTPGSLPRIDRNALVALHRAAYRPDNAILVLTGDITPEQGFALAQQALGGWARPAGAPPAAPLIRPRTAPRNLIVDLPGAGQAAVTVVKTTIARSDPDYYKAILTNAVLGVGYSSRLNQEIRIKRGLSYGAGSGLTPRLSIGGFSAQAQTKNESAAEVVGLVKAEIAGLAARPAGPDELASRKSVLIGGYGRSLGTTGGLADTLGDLAFYGLPLSDISAYTGRVEAVSASDVQAFAAKALDPATASVIVVGDGKVMGPGLAAALPGAEIIAIDNLDLDKPNLRK
jgi:zinc protease